MLALVSGALLALPVLVQAQYCGGGPTSALDSNLGAVHLEGNTKSIDNTNDCPGQIGVQDLTAQAADLSAGQSYTITYQVTTCGGTYTRVSAVWIDYNRDQEFTADEMLGPPIVSSQATDLVTIPFTVPSDAVAGPSRMRVAVQERASPTLQPCDPFGYGGVKDFTIDLLPIYTTTTPPTTQAPDPVSTGLLMLYTDTACAMGPIKIKGSNYTWGTDFRFWTGETLQFAQQAELSAVRLAVTESDPYSLYLDNNLSSLKLGLAHRQAADGKLTGDVAFSWQVTAEGMTSGKCTLWSDFSELAATNQAGTPLLSFLLVKTSY